MNKIAFVLTGARTPLARMILTAVLCLMLGATALIGTGCSDDEGSVTFTEPPEPSSREWLFDVVGTGPNDIYAAGNLGAMFHFDGTSWSQEGMDMGVTTPIVKLWENEGTIFAVGHAGKIWRNTNGQWTSMTSGVTTDLYGIGSYDDEIYACGAEGTLRRWNGSSWTSTANVIVMRDAATGEPDTLNILDRTRDLSSLVAVSHYFIGGAYKKPDFEGEYIGMLGTDGMVLTTDVDEEYDWQLRPIRGDQLAVSEWVLSLSSSALDLSQNYMGTSEGWLFQLTESETGRLTWVKQYPKVTVDPGNGIRDIWLDENLNVYLVTDDGTLIIQTPDYNFSNGTGSRVVLYDQVGTISGIWGTGSDNFYMVGLMENTILHGTLVDNPDTFEAVITPITLDRFLAKGMGIGLDPFTDELGRPRF